MKKNWQFIKEEKAYNDTILSIRHLEYYYKVADKSMVFTVQDMSSWAIIVPVTKEGEFILVRQFRAGTNSKAMLNASPAASCGARQAFKFASMTFSI